jgi:hypothetical protein
VNYREADVHISHKGQPVSGARNFGYLFFVTFVRLVAISLFRFSYCELAGETFFPFTYLPILFKLYSGGSGISHHRLLDFISFVRWV